MRGRHRLALLATVTVAAVAAACDKVPLLGPTGSTITINAGTRVLPIGGTTEITATVLESSGTPVQNGTTVLFTTNLGTLNPVEAQTRNGVATTTFSAGNSSGTAQIRATSGAAGAGTGTGTGTGGTATSANLVEIQVGAAAASAVQVTASPSSVGATGGTVTVIASATDANGNRLVGVPVTFSTTAGTLSTSTATTDASGEARVTLTTTQAATVTARVGNQTGTAAVAVANAAGVTLTATGAPAGQPTTLTITPTAGPVSNVTVEWGDGSTQNLGTVAGARTVTHVYSDPGVYPITVGGTGQFGDTFTTSATATVAARPAPTITASPNSGTTSTTFVFTVTPAANTTARSMRIEFGDGSSEDLGALTGPATVTHRYTGAGSYVIRAVQTDASGGTSSAVTGVTVTSS